MIASEGMAPSMIPSQVETRAEVLRLLGYVFGRTFADGENPSRSRDAEWDSLKHIELIFLLEDHFQVRFSPEQMEEMEDAAAIIKAVEGLRAA